MNGGFVKLYRSIESWEWYKDSNTKDSFLHCLIRSNHKANNWRGQTIESGSFITSLESLAYETGLSIHQVRIALKHLQKTNEITVKTTNRFTQITVIKWGDYQGQDEDDDKQMANKRQTDGKQVATNKNDKKYKNEKNTNKDIKDDVGVNSDTPTKSSFGEFSNVKLTADEHAKITTTGLLAYIDRLSSYKASTGKRYKSDYATILNWARKDGQGKRVEPIPDYAPTNTDPVDIADIKARLTKLGGKA